MRANFARVNDAELDPFFELRFACREKLACALEIHISSEFVDLAEMPRNGIRDGTDQQIIGDFEAEHCRASTNGRLRGCAGSIAHF